nr:ABC transporter permease [Halomonas sp.]
MPFTDAPPTGVQAWIKGRPNGVMMVLAIVMLAALWGLDSVSVAANRIVAGSGHASWEAFGWVGVALASLPLLLVLLLAWAPTSSRLNLLLQLGAIILLLILMPVGLVVASHTLIDPQLPQARLSAGAAFWVVLFCAMLALVELRLRLALPRLWIALVMLGVALLWWLCASLWLDRLALVQEFQAREAAFWDALREHLAMVSIAVGVSIVLGIILALLIRRYRGSQRAAFALLNFFQTIPSLALFGLLLAPLAWISANVPFAANLGIQGIGYTPALLALVIYSLLPMVRNTFVALEAVSPDVLDAATGMGMYPSQRFWQVRVPLALPILLEGIRITAVQAIGLTAVAALIGAGGLGAFIFQGLGQAAMDMVLLGALPILLIALIVDSGLGALGEALRQGASDD